MNERFANVKRLGEKVRHLRKRAGMTQPELASVLGYASKGYMSDIERGKKKPTAEAILTLANHFKVTTDYLLRDDIPVNEAGIDNS